MHFFTAEAALEIAKENSRDSEPILESDISPLRIHMLIASLNYHIGGLTELNSK